MSMTVNKSHEFYFFSDLHFKVIACDNIKDILPNIFSRSLESGIYPSKFKMARVIPIFKADDDSDPNNYRLISFLKLMYTRMISFIDKEGIFCSSQYGFRQKP